MEVTSYTIYPHSIMSNQITYTTIFVPNYRTYSKKIKVALKYKYFFTYLDFFFSFSNIPFISTNNLFKKMESRNLTHFFIQGNLIKFILNYIH
jgi:hypothetical protein